MYMVVVTVILIFSVVNVSTVADDGKPDLIIDNVDCPVAMMEGEHVHIEVIIKNQGDKNISAGTPIDIGLFIDDVLVSTNSTSDGLPTGESCFVNLSWDPLFGDIGEHLLRIWVDHQGLVQESNENNNIWDTYVYVSEKDTELNIEDMAVVGDIWLNKPVTITANVTNNGKDTDDIIFAELDIFQEGVPVYNDSLNTSGLLRGECWNFSMEWIPYLLGSHEINITLLLNGDIEDWQVLPVFVDFEQLDWWNENWHYRTFIGATGRGNGSYAINFTALLANLAVPPNAVENGTICMIEYGTDGQVIGEVATYLFDESDGFDPVANATGTLLWNVTALSEEKYYGIYFDVVGNNGNRTATGEGTNISESGTVTVFYGEPPRPEGWQAYIVAPLPDSCYIINETIDIVVNTTAKAEEVIVDFYHIENMSHHHTIILDDAGDNISWSGNITFTDENEKGNWTFNVSSTDAAGYLPPVKECLLYIGSPDLAVINITLDTNHETFPMIYETDLITITADIRSYFATMYDVVVSLSITNKTDDLVCYEVLLGLTILKDEQNNVSFNWMATEIGDYNITIRVDPDDVIEELNETNNEEITNISVRGLPDLAVVEVMLPTGKIMEYDSVEIDTIIANYGHGNATGYTINLYIESAAHDGMSYNDADKVYSTTFDIDMNASKHVSLIWDSANDGEWIAGVKVLVSGTKRDLNLLNNQLPSNVTLTVQPRDKTLPKISNIAVQPYPQEQGKSVTIKAEVTDDSGLNSVTISITDPSNAVYSGNMMRAGGDWFTFTFEDTFIVGTYTFKIKAEDISVHKNKASKSDSFRITEDATFPLVDYFDARPTVQVMGGTVTLTCIATDNIDIGSVEAIVTYPAGYSENQTMDWSPDGKYVNSSIYEILGKYSLYIRVKDYAGNEVETTSKTFWIVVDTEDTDNDGMPDWWEEKYDLDPKNAIDAYIDSDGDSYDNLKEYTIGTNPQKDIFIQNAIYRMKENGWYLIGSVVLFLVMVFLSIYGKRRRSL